MEYEYFSEMDIFNCKNCNKPTVNDYYGFCSSFCCADYGVKNNLTFINARHPCIYCSVDDQGYERCRLSEKISDLNYEITDLYRRLENFQADADVEKHEYAKQATRELVLSYEKILDERRELLKTIKELTSHSDRFSKMVLQDYEEDE